jgi:hypothetical protein
MFVRYWGYLALVAAVVGAWLHLAALAVLVLAGLALVYLLLLAPLWAAGRKRARAGSAVITLTACYSGAGFASISGSV